MTKWNYFDGVVVGEYAADIVADRLENGEAGPDLLSISFKAA